jgi:hypothetical protein
VAVEFGGILYIFFTAPVALFVDVISCRARRVSVDLNELRQRSSNFMRCGMTPDAAAMVDSAG